MEKKLKTKIVLPVIALAVVGVVSSVYAFSHSGPSAASAQTSSVTAQQTSVDKETADDISKVPNRAEKKPAYSSSIQTADTSEQPNENAEQKQLASLTKITSDEAKAAAEKVLGGTANEVMLENDGGNVVYAVTVGSKEAKVDAGNGKILQTQASDGETNDGNSNE